MAVFSPDKTPFFLVIVIALCSPTLSAQVPTYDFPSFDNLIANSVHQMSFAQTDATVNKQRIVRVPRMFADLDGRGTR